MSIINMIESFDSTSYQPGKVSDMAVGAPIVIHGTLKVLEKKTKTGATYLMTTISDNYGKSASQLIFGGDSRYEFVNNYVGNEVEADVYAIPSRNGSYVNLDIKNIAINIPDPVSEEEILDIKDTKKTLLFNRIDMIVSPFIKQTVLNIFENEDIMNRILTAPATEYSGYAYPGGLADLILTTSNFAQSIADTINMDTSYENSLTINPDILLAGALLCNIGKAYMLEFNEEQNKIIKTETGILENELVITHNIVLNEMNKLEKMLDSITGEQMYIVRPDVKTEILHMIDSSKNQVQWGAISVPRTKHAIILASISQMAFAKGLFEDLEKKYPNDRFSKAYDSGRMYFLPESYLDM